MVGGDSVNQVENDIAAMGLITDHADAARALAGSIVDVGGTCAKQSVAAEPPTRTYVDVGLVLAGRSRSTPTSMTGDLVRLANGINVASEVSPVPAGDVRAAGGAGT